MKKIISKLKNKAGNRSFDFYFYQKFFFTITLWILLSCTALKAQQYIVINGKAMDREQPAVLLEQVMVINLKTQQGIFANPDNTFSIKIEKNDTLVITAYGYRSDKICFRDSVFSESYTVIVPLKRLSVTLKEATVFAPRSLWKIEEDIKKLGYTPKDYRLSGINAWQSPVTALYQEFSRRERSKRKVAELMNTDKRRELMREVLANYSRAGLIEMSYNEYNAFIDYLGLSDLLLQSLTQYELAVYIKEMYYRYREP